MKILMINVVCGVRSTGKICTDIATLAEKKGHEVKIAYGRFDVPNECKKYSFSMSNILDFYSHVGSSLLLDNAGFMSTHATKHLIDFIKDYNPDVIHLHNLHGYYINVKLLFEFLQVYGKPVIWTLHDCWSFTGHCCYYSFNNCDQWKYGCLNCKYKMQYPPSVLLKRAKFNYNLKKTLFNSIDDLFFVTVSNWLKDQVSQSFLNNKQVITIYNGIDTTKYAPSKNRKFREKRTFQNKFIILGVANIWEKRKGLTDFIELSKIVDDHFIIVLVGVSKKQMAMLPQNIYGISRTDNVDELIDIYGSADVYVNTSVEETFGMTTLEALSCGTPVIGYDKTAVPEIITEDVGYVVKAGDVKDVYKKIKLIECGRIKRKNCRMYALNFDKNVLYKKYIDLYEKLVRIK